jgi:glycosyltransferase involved in cell wall biosynthesis
MSKYTIAVFVGAKNGVSYYRQAIPHGHIIRNHSDEFKIIWKAKSDKLTEEELKEVNLVHHCGYYDFNEESLYRKHNIAVVLDKDDWWQLPQNHLRAYEWHIGKIWYRTELSIASADHIICTTNYLADKVKELNKNITIIPNSFDPQLPQFQPQAHIIDPNFIRFGWFGANTHLEDVELLREPFDKLDKEKMMRGRYQVVLGGFSMRDQDRHMLQMDKEGKPKKIRIPDFDTIWSKFERVFTNEYYSLRGKKEYLSYLSRYDETDTIPMQREQYKRIWMKDVSDYCKGYHEIDVAIAPLIDNEFNRCKSQLKLIEAGIFGRPLIASKVYPYQIDGLNDENCILVAANSASNTFHTAMRRFILNPDLIKEMGNNLKELVYDRYDINKVNVERIQLYKHLIDKKNAN